MPGNGQQSFQAVQPTVAPGQPAGWQEYPGGAPPALAQTPCFAGQGQPGNCVTNCSGAGHDIRNLCPTTLCRMSRGGVGQGNYGDWLPCGGTGSYTPQSPAPGGLPTGGTPQTGLNPCNPGEVLQCDPPDNQSADASSFPVGDDGWLGIMPLVPGDDTSSPGQYPAAEAARMLEASSAGLAAVTAAITSGFSQLSQSLESTLAAVSAPIQGDVSRRLDALLPVISKLEDKVYGSVNESLGESVAYAAQLGLPPPTADDLLRLRAGLPLDPLSPVQSSVGSGRQPENAGNTIAGYSYRPGIDPSPPSTPQEIAGLPELTDAIGSCDTFYPDVRMPYGDGECGFIGKDCGSSDNPKRAYYRIPGSKCPPLKGGIDYIPPQLPPFVPTPLPVPIVPVPPVLPPVPPVPPVLPAGGNCFPNRDGSWTVTYPDGSSALYPGPAAPPNCSTYGGYGPDGNPPGGGVLETNPPGILNPIIPGVLDPTPPGVLRPTPGPGGCPPPTVNVPPCPPGPGGSLVVNNITNQPGGVLQTTPTGTAAGGNLQVSVAPSPAPNVIVNVPSPPPTPPPAPQPFSSDTPSIGQRNWVNFQDPNSCRIMAAGSAVLSTQPGGLQSDNLGYLGNAANPVTPTYLDPVMSTTPWWFPNKIVWGITKSVADGIKTGGNFLVKWTECGLADLFVTITSDMMLGWIGRLCGGGTNLARKRVALTEQLKCPVMPPSPQDATLAYYADEIDDLTWSCWTRAGDYCDNPARVIRHAGRTRPDIAGTISLWLRGQLTDAAFKSEMRARGVLEDIDREAFVKLADALPGPGDIVQFMLRDVADQAVVDKYRLDEDFDKKYAGKLKEWGKAQGQSDELMKDYWRQHWHMPSDGQLFEMLHRLRPGKKGVDSPVTLKDVTDALQVNDLMPFWVDKLAAISYRPLSRIDVRRAYEVGSIDLDRVKEAYLDQGYTEEDAETLKKYTERISKAKRAKLAGSMTEAKVIAIYATGALDRDKAKPLLTALGYDDDAASKMLDNADQEYTLRTRIKAISAIRKRYLQGRYQDTEAHSELITVGVNADKGWTLIETWRTEVRLKYRELAQGQLCSLLSRGLIDLQTYRDRMKNVGYEDSDAMKLIQLCVLQNQEKKAKELEAAIAKAEQQAEKQARAAAAARKAAAPCKAPKKPDCPPGTPPQLEG